MARKLNQELEREVLGKAVEGWSARRIAQWLGDDHGIKISFQAIAQLLEKTRTTRADVAKAVVREKLVPQVAGDIELLAKHQAKLDQIADSLAESEPELYFKAVEQLRKVTDTKLHYSGADQPDQAVQAGGVIVLPPEDPE
jgi:hypothetical protein